MTKPQALAAIEENYLDGLEKYGPIQNTNDCMQRLNLFWDRYRAAHNANPGITANPALLKVLAQIAGLCLRGLIDLPVAQEATESAEAAPDS